MKKLMSKALSVVLAFAIGVMPIQSSAGVGVGSSGQSSSWLDTTLTKVTETPVCPECAFENAVPADLTSESFCSRNRCHSLATPSPDTPRVNVAVTEWVTTHSLTEAQVKEVRDEMKRANNSPEKSWNLATVANSTTNKSLPEASLNNFRSLRALNQRNQAERIMAATAISPQMREQAGPPILMGTYASSDGALHIEAIRAIRPLGGGIQIQQADVTPHHFDLFKVTQAYTTKEEQLAGAMGRNPFDFAKSEDSADDKIFRRLSLPGAKVAMGLAMRQTGAAYAVMTITKDTWRQWTEKKGNFFNKTTIYHTGVDTESIYYVFTPATTIYAGDDSVICADNPDNTTCDKALEVRSGVTAAQWTGGTFKDVKQILTYHHEKKVKSSFNFIKVLIIAVLIVVTVGYLAPLIAPALGSIGAAVAEGANAVLATSLTGAEVSAAGSFIAGALPYGGSLVGYAATAAGVSAEMAAGIGAAWNYAVGEVVLYSKQSGRMGDPENEHVLAHNRNLRNHIRKDVRAIAQRYDGNAPDAVTATALGNGSSSMNDVMVPSGSLDMYVQRGRVKPDQHAERLIDIEADLEISR